MLTRFEHVTLLLVVSCIACSGGSYDRGRALPRGSGADAEIESRGGVLGSKTSPPVQPQPLRQEEGTEEATPQPETVSIASTGDLLLTPRAVKAWQGMGPDGLDQMLAGYSRLLRDDEIATLNLETPLVDDVNPLLPGSPPLPPILGAPPETAPALARAGVDLVSIANNHVYDQGFSGLERTLDILESARVLYAGVGSSREDSYRPNVLRHGDVRVAFLAMTGLVNGRAARRGVHRVFVAGLFVEERFLAAISAAREEADLVVVCLHWSTDFVPRPTKQQRRLARRMVNAGADLILGTGPHVLQEVEVLPSDRGDAVVAYSLGNLLSAMALRYRAGVPVNPRLEPSRVRPEGREGVVLRVRFEVSPRSEDTAVDSVQPSLRVATLEAVPIWTHNTYWEHEIEGEPFELRVVPLAEAPIDIERERRPIIASALGDEVELL